MKKQFQTKGLKLTAQMKLNYTVAGILTLQENLYQLSDEKLKKESEDLLHDVILWLKRWLSFSESQFQNLIAIDFHERTKLAFELSFALENRLPVLLTYGRHSISSPGNPYLNEYTSSTKISSYWDATMLIIRLEKNILGHNKPCSEQVSKQLTDMQKIAEKAIHPIVTEFTRFDNLIKYPNGF